MVSKSKASANLLAQLRSANKEKKSKKSHGKKKSKGKKKAKRRGARKWQVMNGSKAKTSGGLTKKDLTINSQGRVVSKKKSQLAKKRYKTNKSLQSWNKAVADAKKDLGLSGFILLNRGKDGKALYKRAKELWVPPILEQFYSMDANNDGVIDKDEAKDAGISAADFKRLDADGDGVISQDELQAFGLKGGDPTVDEAPVEEMQVEQPAQEQEQAQEGMTF